MDESALGSPRRVAVGLEQNRLNMLLAILHRHGGLQVGDQDVFVNAVGGIRVEETSSDLALILAVASSLEIFHFRVIWFVLAKWAYLARLGQYQMDRSDFVRPPNMVSRLLLYLKEIDQNQKSKTSKLYP